MVNEQEVIDNLEVLYHKVKITHGKLPNEVFKGVNKAIKNIGGTWDRSEQAYLFDIDPTDLVKRLQAGERPNIKQESQYFHTSSIIANEMIFMADIPDGALILEPQAGQGHIIDYLPIQQANLHVECCELYEPNRQILEKKGLKIVAEDFLTYQPDYKYDVILANPPFKNRVYMDHIMHMHELIKPDGMVVTVIPSNYTDGSMKRVVKFNEWLDEKTIIKEPIPIDWWDNGAKVPCDIMVINGS